MARTAFGVHSREEWEQLAKTAGYNSRELAKLCQLSTRQLQRRFKLDFGCSPQAWLDVLRLKVARHKLAEGMQVKAVALDCGFKQVSHFCRCFKAECRLTPSQFMLQAAVPEQCRSQVTNVAGR